MEDLDIEEEVMDIDACDERNPLAVAEYIDDIHAHYRKTEVQTFFMLVSSLASLIYTYCNKWAYFSYFSLL